MKRKKGTTQAEILERELTSLEKGLLKTLQERLEHIRSEAPSRSAEFMDTVSSSELDEFTARIVESDSIKIDEIEAALQRLREGQYGICSDCGGGISKKRLKARPFATLCIECKKQAEKSQKGRGDTGSRHSPYTGAADIGAAGWEAESNVYDTMRGSKF